MSGSSFSLVEILRHLEDESASSVLLRAEEAPTFWKDGHRLENQGGFAILRRDDIRRLVCVPLSEEQLREYRQRNFASVPLTIKDLGAFHLEAYVLRGCEEVVISSGARLDPSALFRSHHDLLEEAQRSPDDVTVFWNLGVAFLDEGECQLAWHAFEKALQIAPRDGSIHFQIGKLLGHDLGRVDDAIAALERAATLPPDVSAEVYLELAVMHRSSGRLSNAEDAVRRGLDACPDHASLLEALGVILIELDRAREAIPVLESSLELHGSDPEIEELLAHARASAG